MLTNFKLKSHVHTPYLFPTFLFSLHPITLLHSTNTVMVNSRQKSRTDAKKAKNVTRGQPATRKKSLKDSGENLTGLTISLPKPRPRPAYCGAKPTGGANCNAANTETPSKDIITPQGP
jgi:hypothetical protein